MLGRKSRARGGEQGGTGEVLYVIPTVIEATWVQGAQRRGWTRFAENGMAELEG